jgi:uncharacterized phage-associated protein
MLLRTYLLLLNLRYLCTPFLSPMETFNSKKTPAFEYFLSQAIDVSKIHSLQNNDFSILKTQKLLFLLTAVNAANGSSYLIDEVFDNFVAMPYGPVEIDVYDDTKNDRLNFFKISSTSTIMTSDADFSKLDSNDKKQIDDSIQLLLNKNPNIFGLKANILVEITHMYYSWKLKYSEARQNNSFKEPIPKELIISENKYFSLNPFELI